MPANQEHPGNEGVVAKSKGEQEKKQGGINMAEDLCNKIHLIYVVCHVDISIKDNCTTDTTFIFSNVKTEGKEPQQQQEEEK